MPPHAIPVPSADALPTAPPRSRWKPSVTVAAVIEQEGRYLLVEEHTAEGLRLNNPAGHLELAESPLEAVRREVLEETRCAFEPEAIVGIYMARFTREGAGEDVTYLRITYSGRVGPEEPSRSLDDGIVRTLWLTHEELVAQQARPRSEMVLRCIEDHRRGVRHPLSLVHADATLVTPARKP